MSIKEKIKTAASVFVRPKDWKTKGNMLFDELLLMCLFQKGIAEDELQRRQAAAWADYQSVRKAQVIMTGLMSQLAAAIIVSLVLHNAIAAWVSGILFIVIVTGLVKTFIRSEILWENMNGCYAWLYYEVLHPTHYEIPAGMAKAFEKFCEKSDIESAIGEKKFNRVIAGFGYSPTTLNN